ncbi:Maf-like protein [Colletotrichum scovillei]|uniref:Maf-like protein n=1 Tax=Colletotrichum scovillei TaxID=1209932 RepID=A0A9P7QYS4_9PEZI|nr:Maf-like protein [Colletotrichum scovillei]KAG7049403.1 Maf-like protein [Colletotrichum scovillei]KAG7064145.1 Maf-like protein [Colletotrichum scovillei]
MLLGCLKVFVAAHHLSAPSLNVFPPRIEEAAGDGLLRQRQRLPHRQANHVIEAALNLLDEQHAAHALHGVPARLIRALPRLDVRLDDVVRQAVGLLRKVDFGLLRVLADLIARRPGVLPRCDDAHGRQHPVHAGIPQVAQHLDVFGLAPRLLEDAAVAGDDDGVSGDDEVRVRDGGEVRLQGRLVDVEALLAGRGGDVLIGPVGGLIEVLGLRRGCDFEVLEADLGEEGAPPRGGGGEDHALGFEVGEDGEVEGQRPSWAAGTAGCGGGCSWPGEVLGGLCVFGWRVGGGLYVGHGDVGGGRLGVYRVEGEALDLCGGWARFGVNWAIQKNLVYFF